MYKQIFRSYYFLKCSKSYIYLSDVLSNNKNIIKLHMTKIAYISALIMECKLTLKYILKSATEDTDMQNSFFDLGGPLLGQK